MREDIAMQWAAILESGEFKQGTGMLRSVEGDKYCCLGVLCEMAVREGVIPPARVTYSEGRYTYGVEPEICEEEDKREHTHTTLLPEAVLQWSGMQTYVGRFGKYGAVLANLNDEGTEFPRIAELIRENHAIL